MSAREEILARVRAAVPNMPEEDEIPQRYRRPGVLGQSERLLQFVARLTDYNAGVYRCAEERVPETVARVMRERGRERLVIANDFPEAWLPPGMEIVRDRGLTHEDLDRAAGVLTACTVAISLTGTIVLTHSVAEGRRALTLIPDYHLCVVRAAQVVETTPEGFDRLRGMERRPITTIAGPSATADIEMTRIKGVHGPRFLDVILAEGEA